MKYVPQSYNLHCAGCGMEGRTEIPKDPLSVKLPGKWIEVLVRGAEMDQSQIFFHSYHCMATWAYQQDTRERYTPAPPFEGESTAVKEMRKRALGR